MRFDVHPRTFEENLYVYAVLSRRARGVSIGINLNPDKICNFDCVYCQVDRTTPPALRRVDPVRLKSELARVLDLALSEPLDRLVSLEGVPAAYRALADVAFSGDGEPTSHPEWPEWVERTGEMLEERGAQIPMTLITNASLFHRPRVRDGLDRLAARGGRVWAKLDAGTEGFFREVAKTKIPFERILDNIKQEACRRPIVIQALFYRVGEREPPPSEIAAWAQRLAEIRDGGGSLAAVQVTTVARRPPSPEILALPERTLEEIAGAARRALPGVDVEVYPSRPAEPAMGGGRDPLEPSQGEDRR